MQTGTTQMWALALMLFCLVVLPFALAYLRNNTGAGVVAAACGLGAVMLFLPQVQSLRFGILEAKMRDQIEEASATLAQLRSLAADLARVAVLGVVEQGGLGGPSVQTFYVIRKDLERQLIALHATPDDAKEILEPLNNRIQVAFEIEIEDTISVGKLQTTDVQALFKCLAQLRQHAVVEKIRVCIETLSTITPEAERLMKELAEFQQTAHVARLDAGLVR